MNKISAIEFDDKTKKYECFLNTYPLDMLIDGQTFPTVLNYYYYKMYEGIDAAFAEELRVTDVRDIKAVADKKKKEVKDEWYTNRLNVLFTAIRYKFENNEDMKKILISTNNHYLEYQNRDSFFGNGKGSAGGCNILGKVLMEVRNELK
jgi:ribA/ribD-fused uncharacterized protein